MNNDIETLFEDDEDIKLKDEDDLDDFIKDPSLDNVFPDRENNKEIKKEEKKEIKEDILEEKEDDAIKENKKMKLWQKILIILICLGLVFGATLVFLLYGPYSNFRQWLITTAMTTMNHQYLATFFYDDDTINEVMQNNYVLESSQETDLDAISFKDYSNSKVMYKNKYEKEVLTHNEGDIYKLININEDVMRGYLVVIYDASKVKMATASNMSYTGEMLTTIAKKNNAVVAMNASGFLDPGHVSNGSNPIGAVIKDGKIVSNLGKASTGGIIGFTNDNKLILGKMSADEALSKGVRDAMEFGPFLVVNGEPSFIKGNGGWGTAPRSAIGQRQDGIVLFLVMDGRDYINGIDGVGMVELTEIMMRYGAYNASNLDGGTSCGLVINGVLTNQPINGSGEKATRAIPNAWIVSK